MLTRLDIINDMISSTGSRPLLAGQTRHPMYLKADTLLTRVVSTVLSLGLWFNTECRILKPQPDGKVMVPTNCIKAESLSGPNVSLRGNCLWDLNTGAPWDDGPIAVRMLFDLNLEDIDIVAKDYIRARATYEFYLGDNGADPKLSNYRNERDNAWVVLWRDHIRNRKTSVLDNPHGTINRLRRGYPHGFNYPVGRIR